MALRPSLTHPGPGAHAPLGSNDTDRHNDKGEEAAGADARQHHQQGDERLAAQAEAALAGGSSCRDRARAAGGRRHPRPPGPPNPGGHQDTGRLAHLGREGPWLGFGFGDRRRHLQQG